jgi:hypothetical protein
MEYIYIEFLRKRQKIPLRIHRRPWKDNIKMNLREMGLGDIDWIHLAQDRDLWRDPRIP